MSEGEREREKARRGQIADRERVEVRVVGLCVF